MGGARQVPPGYERTDAHGGEGDDDDDQDPGPSKALRGWDQYLVLGHGGAPGGTSLSNCCSPAGVLWLWLRLRQ
jgi:hypothetical protein